jgi:hypothetical protein
VDASRNSAHSIKLNISLRSIHSSAAVNQSGSVRTEILANRIDSIYRLKLNTHTALARALDDIQTSVNHLLPKLNISVLLKHYTQCNDKARPRTESTVNRSRLTLNSNDNQMYRMINTDTPGWQGKKSMSSKSQRYSASLCIFSVRKTVFGMFATVCFATFSR